MSILDAPRHPSRSLQRDREYVSARRAADDGDPWPMLEYQAKYRSQPHFSADEDEVIRVFYPIWGGRRVASVLRRYPLQVSQRASTLGVNSESGQGKQHRFLWDEDKHPEIVHRMHAGGATQAEIGEALGMSAANAGRWIKRLGLKPHKGVRNRRKP